MTKVSFRVCNQENAKESLFKTIPCLLLLAKYVSEHKVNRALTCRDCYASALSDSEDVCWKRQHNLTDDQLNKRLTSLIYGWGILPHLPRSLGLIPSDYHLFGSLFFYPRSDFKQMSLLLNRGSKNGYLCVLAPRTRGINIESNYFVK